LNRRFALKVIFLIPAIFMISFGAVPVQALAQEAREQEQVSEQGNRNRAAFSTLDTLDASDFTRPAPSVTPAKTPRLTSAKKKTGAAVEPVVPDAGAKLIEPELIAISGHADIAVLSRSEAGGEYTAQTSSGNAAIDELVIQAAAKYRLDPNLIFAVMRQESSFNPRATSPKGARGLMQLMPATAMRLGVRDIYDPAQNIDGGARYLRFLLDTFGGDVELTLAGYNAGEGAVARYGNRIPPYRETINYVQRISAHYTRLRGSVGLRGQIRQAPRSEQAQTVELIRGMRRLSQY
jgi:hypothetical protein